MQVQYHKSPICHVPANATSLDDVELDPKWSFNIVRRNIRDFLVRDCQLERSAYISIRDDVAFDGAMELIMIAQKAVSLALTCLLH